MILIFLQSNKMIKCTDYYTVYIGVRMILYKVFITVINTCYNIIEPDIKKKKILVKSPEFCLK